MMPRSMSAVWIVLLVAITTFYTMSGQVVAAGKSLRCMMCQNAASLMECEHMITCHPYQICYVEEEYRFNGVTVVHAGCRNSTECDSAGCFGENVQRQRRDSKFGRNVQGRQLKCHHCCATEFCNMYGCPDTYDVSHLKGSRCLSCEEVRSPEECTKVVNCEPHQECFASLIGFGSEVRYNLGCERKALCDMLAKIYANGRKKRSSILDSRCCSSHLCNRQVPLTEKAPSPYSDVYRCPAPAEHTSPPTTPTTDTTPTTTPIIPTAQTTTNLPQSTIPPDQCVDKLNCQVYDHASACSGQWETWGRINCPAFCGYCTETRPAQCQDKIDCNPYGRDYACQGQYIPWAQDNCPRFCGFCVDPEASIDGPGTTVPEVLECKDAIDCSPYGKDYACGGEFTPWAQANCPMYCGFCIAEQTVPTSPPPTTAEVCEDSIDCTLYDKMTACTDLYLPWAKLNCPRYCGICTVPRATIPGCVDQLEDCAIYGVSVCTNSEFWLWTQENCRAFCGLCYVSTPPPSTSPTTTTTSTSTSTSTSTTSTTTPPTTPSTTMPRTDCYDAVDCSIYDVSLVCGGEYQRWAHQNCRKSCNLCETCVDHVTNCADMGPDLCTLDMFKDVRESMCRSTCGLC